MNDILNILIYCWIDFIQNFLIVAYIWVFQKTANHTDLEWHEDDTFMTIFIFEWNLFKYYFI